jgi:hypothetical protein
MGVDSGEVEFSSNQEQHSAHGFKASETTRLALGGLEQAVDSFDKSIRLTGLGPSDNVSVQPLHLYSTSGVN